MRIESEAVGQDETPAIDPRVEKATNQLFHKISRVVVEVKAPGEGTGFRKLNAISLAGLPLQTRTPEQEDELNIAVMQIAMAHVEETGESNRFRARYMGSADTSGRGLRKYACFKISVDDEAVSNGPFAAMTSMPAAIEPWIPVVRWLMSLLEGREQQLMAYNETMTNKLLETAAQAEPLLKAHGAMSGILEQAVRMLSESGSRPVVDGAQLLAGQDDGGGLQQIILSALLQHFTKGQVQPPDIPGMNMGGAEMPPPPPPPSSGPPPGPGPGADVRFGFDARAPKPPGAQYGATKKKTETAAGALVRAVRKLFGCMDCMKLLALTDSLGAHYESLCAVRAARNDSEAAQAVAQMQGGGGWKVLREQLGDTERVVMDEIEALVPQRSDSANETKKSVQVDADNPLVQTVQTCLETMDGELGMELLDQLSARERKLLQAVRIAKTDDAAAKAVLALKAALLADDDKVSLLTGKLGEMERSLFKMVDAMAMKHGDPSDVEDAEGNADVDTPTKAGEVPVGVASAPVKAMAKQPAPNANVPTKVEAVLCLSPKDKGGARTGGPLLQAAQAWLKSMNGDQGMGLLSSLTLEQRKSLQAVRAAQTDDDVARAVLAFKASLERSMNWMGLVSRLGQEHLGMLLRIQTLAQQHLGK